MCQERDPLPLGFYPAQQSKIIDWRADCWEMPHVGSACGFFPKMDISLCPSVTISVRPEIEVLRSVPEESRSEYGIFLIFYVVGA